MAMLCVCENNKENIPPTMSKQPNTIGAVSTIPTTKKRATTRTRIPLQDITNLFYSVPIPNSAALSLSSHILVSNAKHRKRRAEIDSDFFSMQNSTALVSLRKCFR
ncbi:unnamed protein product [Camellia sinensis]